MALASPTVLAQQLLGRAPDRVQPLVVWDHRATFRCRIGADEFVCKADENLEELAREVQGHTRAAAAGVPVPELVATARGALAMRWVAGTALHARSSAQAWRAAGSVVRAIHDLSLPESETGGGFLPRRSTWIESVDAEADAELTSCVSRHGVAPSTAARIRDAIVAARADLAAAPLSCCHGDLQPDHVLLDPRTDQVVAVLDWSDCGTGDAGWDLAVLTLDDAPRLPDFVAGYGAPPGLVSLYRAVRLLGEVRWLHAHMPDAVPRVLAQLADWRPTP